MFTIPFYELLDYDSDTWSYIRENSNYEQLFPDVDYGTIEDDFIYNVNNHFYYREIAFTSPIKFIRKFQRIITERIATWKKLIASEDALTDDDRTFNYIMIEHGEGNSTSKETPRVETTVEGTGEARGMDTPDGLTDDIENYLSSASANKSTSVTSYTGENNSENAYETNLNRKGNIGVTVASRILGGYRDAQSWCTYDEVIFPELEECFLHIFDMEEV